MRRVLIVRFMIFTTAQEDLIPSLESHTLPMVLKRVCWISGG